MEAGGRADKWDGQRALEPPSSMVMVGIVFIFKKYEAIHNWKAVELQIPFRRVN